MERIPEYGVCRLIQSHVTTVLAESEHTLNSGAVVQSQDEGDYETKLASSLAKHWGIFALVTVTGLNRNGSGMWEVALEVVVHEQINLNRGGNQASQWTALRYAEMILATFHETQMTEKPYAYLQADAGAVQLEQEISPIIYRVRLLARLGQVLRF